MLYAILKRTYRWLFLTMREAQFLCDRFKAYPSPLRKQYKEERDELVALVSSFFAIIDPEEHAYHQKTKQFFSH